MDKYLINILKDVNTIIIPGIGALTIVNQATGEVMFMSFMKFDDGKLAEYIAEKENWELNEAKNLVSKYVRDINAKLDQGNSYDIYQFGTFTKNVEGEIEFTAWNGSSEANSNNSEESIVENSPIIELETAPFIEEIVDEPVEEALAEKIEKTIEDIAEIKEDQSSEIKEQIVNNTTVFKDETEDIIEEQKVIPVEPIIEVVAPIIPPLTEEEQLKDDLDIPPINQTKVVPKKPILEKTKKDKVKKSKGVGFYILMGLLVFIVGAGVFVAINYNEMKQYIPFLNDKTSNEKLIVQKEKVVEPEEDITEEISDEPASTETEEAPSTEQEPEVTETTPATPTPVASNSGIDKSLPIQAIVGSFSDVSNANRKVDALRTAGMNAEVIGQYGGLYFVSAGSFSTMAELKSQSEQLKSAGKYWIFKK